MRTAQEVPANVPRGYEGTERAPYSDIGSNQGDRAETAVHVQEVRRWEKREGENEEVRKRER